MELNGSDIETLSSLSTRSSHVNCATRANTNNVTRVKPRQHARFGDIAGCKAFPVHKMDSVCLRVTAKSPSSSSSSSSSSSFPSPRRSSRSPRLNDFSLKASSSKSLESSSCLSPASPRLKSSTLLSTSASVEIMRISNCSSASSNVFDLRRVRQTNVPLSRRRRGKDGPFSTSSSSSSSSSSSRLFPPPLLLLFLLAAAISSFSPPLASANFLSLFAAQNSVAKDPCYSASGKPVKCVPDFVNAAFGKNVQASSTCGTPPSRYCVTSMGTNGEVVRNCRVCDAAVAKQR